MEGYHHFKGRNLILNTAKNVQWSTLLTHLNDSGFVCQAIIIHVHGTMWSHIIIYCEKHVNYQHIRLSLPSRKQSNVHVRLTLRWSKWYSSRILAFPVLSDVPTNIKGTCPWKSKTNLMRVFSDFCALSRDKSPIPVWQKCKWILEDFHKNGDDWLA